MRERAQQVCEAAGIRIEHVNKSHIRKEDLVARVLATRGNAPGLVHVISAMESCPSDKPWLDKSNGHVFLRGDTGTLGSGLNTVRIKHTAIFQGGFSLTPVTCEQEPAVACWRRPRGLKRTVLRPDPVTPGA